jgi:IPT/TIG domain-containing protein
MYLLKCKIMKTYLYKTLQFTCMVLLAMVMLPACEKDKEGPAAPDKLEPEAAAADAILSLTGSGLSSVKTIVFETENILADFNPVFNSSGAIIFRVPADAVPGKQNIIFTKASGEQFKVSFTVLGLANIISVSNYNFTPGAELTLTGKNLDDVSKVVLHGTTTEVTIKSKTATTLVLTMPATTINRATLDITNKAGTAATSQEFVNMDNAYQIFTDGYKNDFVDASWGDPGTISTTIVKNGASSVFKNYQKGNWHLIQFASWNTGVTYSADYKFLTFWIKGGSKEYTLYVTGDQRTGGFGNGDRSAPIVVPANEWKYFKLPLEPLGLWAKGNIFKQLGFWIPGPDDQDEKIYYDDVMIIK